MARPKGINYRKLAFEAYAPVCVFCGFGIEAVLEVAHIDCDPANCAINNLVILCPTCHRMLDIDLIPAEVVSRLRDEKRKPNWRKLMKNAAEKAIATKRAQPGLLSEVALKAVATRRERAAAMAKRTTRSKQERAGKDPEISWTSVGRLPGNLGHGVQFLAQSADGARMIAWLEGFEWLHSKPDQVKILITDDNSLLPAARAAALKAAVERRIRAGELMSGPICDGVHALVNG